MKRFSNKRNGWNTNRAWRKDARYGGVVDCPQAGEAVLRVDCLGCSSYGVWHTGDNERCKYEYEDMKNRGLFAKDQDEWLEHLHNADPDTWRDLIEEKRNNERVRSEIEMENRTRHGTIENEAEGIERESEFGEIKKEQEQGENNSGDNDRGKGFDDEDDKKPFDNEDEEDDENDYWL